MKKIAEVIKNAENIVRNMVAHAMKNHKINMQYIVLEKHS